MWRKKKRIKSYNDLELFSETHTQVQSKNPDKSKVSMNIF